jgi:thiol-disulfide isomerase/thioredoxin
MKMNSTVWTVIIAIIVIGGTIGGIFFLDAKNTKGEELIPFASCLKDKGATFYGTFWCPHCREQKTIFGKAAPSLPYVECSTPDGSAQNDTCNEKEIKKYPTWEFADGERIEGVLTIEQLAEKTACEIPAVTTQAK